MPRFCFYLKKTAIFFGTQMSATLKKMQDKINLNRGSINTYIKFETKKELTASFKDTQCIGLMPLNFRYECLFGIVCMHTHIHF